jgi:hypothetical protein
MPYGSLQKHFMSRNLWGNGVVRVDLILCLHMDPCTPEYTHTQVNWWDIKKKRGALCQHWIQERGFANTLRDVGQVHCRCKYCVAKMTTDKFIIWKGLVSRGNLILSSPELRRILRKTKRSEVRHRLDSAASSISNGPCPIYSANLQQHSTKQTQL